MKEVAGKIEEFPENPPWTMFFDGPLYQKYDEFMKTKDFSKILLNTKLRLANFHGSEVVSPAHSVEVDSWDKEQEVDPTGNTYQYVSEDYFQRIKEDEKRRTRRTRAFIIIGFVIMAALAFGTALVIHYLFIPPLEERNPKNFVNVSFSANTTAPVTPEITHTTPVDEHEAEMSRMLNELLKGAHHHSHDHDHEHILNPDGKIFDDHFITTTQETTTQETTSLEASAGDTETTTLTTSTPSPTTTKTAMFILNLRPKIQQEEPQGIFQGTSSSASTETTTIPVFSKTTAVLPESTTTVPNTTTALHETTSTLPKTTTTLQETTSTMPETTITLQETTTTPPKTTTTSQEITSTLPKTTTTLQETTTTLPKTTTTLQETTSTLPKTTTTLHETTTTLPKTTTTLLETTTMMPETTITLQETTTTPQKTTTRLQETTTTLLKTTTPLQETTSTLPKTTTISQKTTTTLPKTTTSLQETTSMLPKTTTTLQETTTTTPETTTTLHETTTTLPKTTTTLQGTTSKLPKTTTTLQETTTTLPKTTTTLQETTSKLPKTTTTLQETTTTTPETTTTLHETTTTLPETTTTLQETTTPLPITTTTLQETTTTLPKTTTSIQGTTTTLSETTTILHETTLTLPKTTTTLQETTTTTPETTTTLHETTTTLPKTTTTLQETTTTLPETTTTLQETTTTLPKTTTTLQETTTTLPETTTTLQETTTTLSKTTTTLLETTTALQETTMLPEKYNIVQMTDVTSYTFENAKINCIVKHAIKWKSLSVKINQKWRPLEVTLFPSGEIKWSRRKTKRHDVTYDITNSTDGTGSNMTISLIINDVQCRDKNTYICTLKSDTEDGVAKSQLTVVELKKFKEVATHSCDHSEHSAHTSCPWSETKPSQKITLTPGPSIIEDKAFRLTATWQGGYPIPWANMSWTAFDSNNKSYNLANYGEYRDYALHEDHQFCQTTLQHSIVVFPRIHLNDTTVIVRPNLERKKYFVDKSMETYLRQVKPGVEKILVIPLNYCKNGKKDMSVPHPYTPCTKFLRCLSGDIIVQECPIGTCFNKEKQQCA